MLFKNIWDFPRSPSWLIMLVFNTENSGLLHLYWNKSVQGTFCLITILIFGEGVP